MALIPLDGKTMGNIGDLIIATTDQRYIVGDTFRFKDTSAAAPGGATTSTTGSSTTTIREFVYAYTSGGFVANQPVILSEFGTTGSGQEFRAIVIAATTTYTARIGACPSVAITTAPSYAFFGSKGVHPVLLATTGNAGAIATAAATTATTGLVCTAATANSIITCGWVTGTANTTGGVALVNLNGRMVGTS